MIKEGRTWSVTDVQQICINENLYTKGDNADYTKMLDFIKIHKPTKANIKKVAEDILRHSNTDLNLISLMFMIYIKVQVFCYECDQELLTSRFFAQSKKSLDFKLTLRVSGSSRVFFQKSLDFK